MDEEEKNKIRKLAKGIVSGAPDMFETMLRNNYIIFYNKHPKTPEISEELIEYSYMDSDLNEWCFLIDDFKEGFSDARLKRIVNQNQRFKEKILFSSKRHKDWWKKGLL